MIEDNVYNLFLTNHTRVCQGKCPGSQSGNNKIKYQDMLTVLTNTTNDLSMPCHEQRTGAATANSTLDGDLVIVVHLTLLRLEAFLLRHRVNITVSLYKARHLYARVRVCVGIGNLLSCAFYHSLHTHEYVHAWSRSFIQRFARRAHSDLKSAQGERVFLHSLVYIFYRCTTYLSQIYVQYIMHES